MYLNIETSTLDEIIKVGTVTNIINKVELVVNELTSRTEEKHLLEREVDKLEDRLFDATTLMIDIVDAMCEEPDCADLKLAINTLIENSQFEF